jgi:hypothetical protein
MQIFRTTLEQPESGDFRQLPGYENLSPESQKQVHETYNSVLRSRQSLGIKLAQGTAYATAKALTEQILQERHCQECGRQMKEVRKGNTTHKFCPVCHPKSMGYGEIKRIKEDDAASMQHQNVIKKDADEEQMVQNPSFGQSLEAVNSLSGDSGERQKENVTKKDAQEEQPNPTKVGSWGPSPAYPPGSEIGAPLTPATGAKAIFNKNHVDKGEPIGESEGPAYEGCTTQCKGDDHSKNCRFSSAHLPKPKSVRESAESMTEAEYQLFEDDVTNSIRAAKHNGFELNGTPTHGKLGTSFDLKHPEGHRLRVHIAKSGMGWYHTHKNGTRKSGSNPHELVHHLQNVDEKYVGFDKLKNKLSNEKGVTDPGALAASIGRKKYGPKGFSTHKHGEVKEAEKAAGAKAAKTSTSSDVRSPTKTSTETSTDAYTAGNVTVTGGAGAGATTVTIHQHKLPEDPKGSIRSKGEVKGEVKEAETTDKHGNKSTAWDPSHPSHKAGQEYGKKLSKQFGQNGLWTRLHYHKNRTTDPEHPAQMVHVASTKHLRDHHADSSLQTKLDAQRHFKNGAGHALGANLNNPFGIKENESSKELQADNFQEKCDFCNKKHAVGPCPQGNYYHKDDLKLHVKETIDPTLQAAVDYISTRVNVRGIMEQSMPQPTIHTRDKWSNSLLVEAKGPLASEHPLHKIAISHGYGHQKSTHHNEGARPDTVHEYHHPGYGHTLQLMSEPKTKDGKLYHHYTHRTFSKHSDEPLYHNGTTAHELETRLKHTHV